MNILATLDSSLAATATTTPCSTSQALDSLELLLISGGDIVFDWGIIATNPQKPGPRFDK